MSSFYLSKEAKRNYDKIFNKKSSTNEWAWRYPEFDYIPASSLKGLPIPHELFKEMFGRWGSLIENPYNGRGSFSSELSFSQNDRIDKILAKAEKNGFEHKLDDYQIMSEKCFSDRDLSMSSLMLRGLFVHPQFIKAYFETYRLPFDAATYHANLFCAETVEDMLTYLEKFL